MQRGEGVCDFASRRELYKPGALSLHALPHHTNDALSTEHRVLLPPIYYNYQSRIGDGSIASHGAFGGRGVCVGESETVGKWREGRRGGGVEYMKGDDQESGESSASTRFALAVSSSSPSSFHLFSFHLFSSPSICLDSTFEVTKAPAQ